MSPTRGPAQRQRGLTLLEIMFAAAILAVASMGVAATMMTGIASNRRYQRDTIVLARAQHYLETCYNLQFGTDEDAPATAAELETVFSGDPEIGSDPPSLFALCKAIDQLPGFVYAFTPPNFQVPGTFLVRVTNNVSSEVDYPAGVDADDDGVPDFGMATMAEALLVPQVAAGAYEADDSDEGRELFCIEIFWQPDRPGSAAQLVLRGFRAQDY